jgi:hypothetical protein
MPHDPPGEDARQAAEAAFLTELWDDLEAALEIATSQNVLSRLDEVLAHCEASAETIRRWRANSQ